MAAPPEALIRARARRRVTDLFGVPEASLSLADRFGDDLVAAPPSDVRLNAHDLLLDDIQWVADRELLKALCGGQLVIQTVGQYCDHMVRCSRVNPARVADVLKLDIAIEPPALSQAEKAMRIGCGALLGVVAGLVAVIKLALDSLGSAAAVIAAAVVVCGFLALRYGDEFWHAVLGRRE